MEAFHYPVPLWMVGRGLAVGDSFVFEPARELLAHELTAVICRDLLWESRPRKDLGQTSDDDLTSGGSDRDGLRPPHCRIDAG